LSLLVRELQQYRWTPARLAAVADQVKSTGRLQAKLHDLVLLMEGYLDWLRTERLLDADALLDLAADELLSVAAGGAPFPIAGLWLDGFAQLTPQERRLLGAVLPSCERATLAFCLADLPAENVSWHSPSGLIARTFQQCREDVAGMRNAQIGVELLQRNPERSRFAGEPMLQHLERSWAEPGPFTEKRSAATAEHSPARPAIQFVVCTDPEAEAVFAARAILRFVRDGGRFRETAVLVRKLESYYDPVRRVFSRYGIPCFLDRREAVAHHPLAELTRSALRTVALGWRHEDWFSALKSGLVNASEAEIDWLETAALAHGWEGKAWGVELRGQNGGPAAGLEPLRQRLVPPFQELARAAARPLSGTQLAEAIRQLWSALHVEKILDEWSAAEALSSNRALAPANHVTVWNQMEDWLDNLARAFPKDTQPIRDWLPVLEAGLAGLTVGVIPPVLDQVLVGSVDRSRNPDLRLALVLGVNESVFPARPAAPNLLTETDRDQLAQAGHALGTGTRWQLGHEWFYGYIACTRARERVVLTCAACDAQGRALTPSPFLDRLRRLFPNLKPEVFSGSSDWRASEHPIELMAPLLRNKGEVSGRRLRTLSNLESLPAFAPILEQWEAFDRARRNQQLSPRIAEKLYGPELETSVSGLESFAQCPFKFLVRRGLRAKERKNFVLDQRQKGDFQHQVLNRFHRSLQAAGRQWRDLTPDEARRMIGRIGEELASEFGGGLMVADAARRFTSRTLIERLERLMETLIGWMPQYQFDPCAVEVGFGLEEGSLPGWRLDLGGNHALVLRGRIDRIDLCRRDEVGAALSVVIDYKSSERKLDPVKLHHGLELQLLGYLAVLRNVSDARRIFHVARLAPAGVFYVSLRGAFGSGPDRAGVIEGRDRARKESFQHAGRFAREALPFFDNRNAPKGDQFRYFKTKEGSFSKRGNDAVPESELQALLDKVEGHLRDYGRRIFAGETQAAPFRRNAETACDHCDYRSICRFDPWTEPYRVLRPPEAGHSAQRGPDQADNDERAD
jgi:ATP-dependent helicase/nuclease subunit B